jgi:uncharacterized protein (TIGR00369 family)
MSERSRLITWGDPQEILNAARDLSGREFLEGMRLGSIDAVPFAAAMGMRLEEVGDGRVVFTLAPEEFLYNGIALVHGGATATLCDSAIGCAILSLLPAGHAAVTLDLAVRYYKPITKATGTVRCEGITINRGRTTATAEARVLDRSGRLHASATSTCAIVAHRGPAVL